MDIEKKKWEILCSKEDIAARVEELGVQISKDYENKKLFILSLLKGSFIFASDIARSVSVPVKIGFMTTSSYEDKFESKGSVNVLNDITEDIEGYDVLVVDDITDSGITMKYVVEHLKGKKPASVKSCVLLDKPSRRAVDYQADYIGFTIEDKFVVGYGLDYSSYYRNIPYVFAVTDEDR